MRINTTTERREQLFELDGTARSRTERRSLLHMVLEQARRRPEALAVVCGDENLTYRELDERSEPLAARLQDAGARPGDLIATLLGETHAIAVAWLAIMRAGAAFVPLDVNAHPKLLDSMTRALGLRTVVADGSAHRFPGGADTRILAVDDGGGEPRRRHRPHFPHPLSVAYVMHTSGSTGRPKAVAIPHRGLLNRLAWMNEFFGDGGARKVLKTTRHLFDSAVWQIFWPLMNGGTCVIIDAGRIDPRAMTRLLAQHEFSTIDFVPSVFRALFARSDAEPRRRFRCGNVIFGAEELTPETAREGRKLLGPHGAMVNMYGPTEASIGCLCHVLSPAERSPIPIGRPISNTRVYVLDDRLNPVPAGIAGELCIAGDGLAHGYFGQAGLTAERFVADPFGPPGERMYRTGDSATWNGDGELLFLGRIDEQVKIRGHRIELGGVESALRAHPLVRDAVVVARGDERGHKQLVAYVVLHEHHDVSTPPSRLPAASALREHLQRELAEYMIPATFVLLPELPLASSGKVDKKALPPPRRGFGLSDYVAPTSRTEQILAELWADVLRIEQAGIEDGFIELGGDSLAAMQLSERIRHVFMVDVPLQRMLANPKLRQLGDEIDYAMLAGNRHKRVATPSHVDEPCDYGEI